MTYYLCDQARTLGSCRLLHIKVLPVSSTHSSPMQLFGSTWDKSRRLSLIITSYHPREIYWENNRARSPRRNSWTHKSRTVRGWIAAIVLILVGWHKTHVYIVSELNINWLQRLPNFPHLSWLPTLKAFWRRSNESSEQIPGPHFSHDAYF